MTVTCVYGGTSKDTALCVDLCSQLCVYHVFCVCVCSCTHVCTCAPIGICVLTGPGDREPQWPHTYWARKGGMLLGTWIQPPSNIVLNCRCSEVFSAVNNWELTIFTEMMGTCALNHFLYIRTHLHLIPGASHWSHTRILIIRKLCLWGGGSSGTNLKWSFTLGLNPHMLLPHYRIVC